MEALHRSGSLRLKPDRGEGSFTDLANFPEAEVFARIRGRCWWWGRSCKSSWHMFLTYILTRSLRTSLHVPYLYMETWTTTWVRLRRQWKLSNLKIAPGAAQSRDCKKINVQPRDWQRREGLVYQYFHRC